MTQPLNNLADYSAKPGQLHLVIPQDMAGLRLDQALQKLLPEYSRSRLQEWIRQQRVTVAGQGATPKQAVWGGEAVFVEPLALPAENAFVAQEIALDIAFEDEALIVINKPAGLVVHPGSGNWEGTLLNALLHHAPQLSGIPRAGIVHRLDKDTSGLLVVAKTLTAQTDLVRQLQARTVKREYLALAQGIVANDGEVTAPIGRHPQQRTKMAIVSGGKPARTHYRIVERFAAHTLLECRLETGRTHQIRVHLQSIGHSLAGDPVYGGRQVAATPAVREAVGRLGRQALHATRLGLFHPGSRDLMEWHIEMPADMLELLGALRGEA